MVLRGVKICFLQSVADSREDTYIEVFVFFKWMGLIISTVIKGFTVKSLDAGGQTQSIVTFEFNTLLPREMDSSKKKRKKRKKNSVAASAY